ncbi:hypothetical protein R1flu_018142 [Riccia fluitans]|uniref:Uncharacterized protein n=1 Tax=Riccia fluitans TaxID=41844 RepID=A0ABD1ZIX0_9MARC
MYRGLKLEENCSTKRTAAPKKEQEVQTNGRHCQYFSRSESFTDKKHTHACHFSHYFSQASRRVRSLHHLPCHATPLPSRKPLQCLSDDKAAVKAAVAATKSAVIHQRRQQRAIVANSSYTLP